jgi:hypothetical protein
VGSVGHLTLIGNLACKRQHLLCTIDFAITVFEFVKARTRLTKFIGGTNVTLGIAEASWFSSTVPSRPPSGRTPTSDRQEYQSPGLTELGLLPHVPARSPAYSGLTTTKLFANLEAIGTHRSLILTDMDINTRARSVLPRSYLASLPERTVRAGAALTGGLVYESPDEASDEENADRG